jgi:hypothetical protein
MSAFNGLSISPIFLQTLLSSAPSDVVNGTTAIAYRRGGRNVIQPNRWTLSHCTNWRGSYQPISSIPTFLNACRQHDIISPPSSLPHFPIEEEVIIPCNPGTSKSCANSSNTRAICRILGGLPNTDLTFTQTTINLSPENNTGLRVSPGPCGQASCINGTSTVPTTITCPAVI